MYMGETKLQKEVQLVTCYDEFAKEIKQNIKKEIKSHFKSKAKEETNKNVGALKN
jgi:uncharacterized protein YlbG (UPF0298 family)